MVLEIDIDTIVLEQINAVEVEIMNQYNQN